MRGTIQQILDKSEFLTKWINFPVEIHLPHFRKVGLALSSLIFHNAPNCCKKRALSEEALVERLSIDGPWLKIRTSRGFARWAHRKILRSFNHCRKKSALEDKVVYFRVN